MAKSGMKLRRPPPPIRRSRGSLWTGLKSLAGKIMRPSRMVGLGSETVSDYSSGDYNYDDYGDYAYDEYAYDDDYYDYYGDNYDMDYAGSSLQISVVKPDKDKGLPGSNLHNTDLRKIDIDIYREREKYRDINIKDIIIARNVLRVLLL